MTFVLAELIKEPTPLKAIDFCYHDEDEMVTVLDCITLCVMVVSYSAENTRGYQMLVSKLLLVSFLFRKGIFNRIFAFLDYTRSNFALLHATNSIAVLHTIGE